MPAQVESARSHVVIDLRDGAADALSVTQGRGLSHTYDRLSGIKQLLAITDIAFLVAVVLLLDTVLFGNPLRIAGAVWSPQLGVASAMIIAAAPLMWSKQGLYRLGHDRSTARRSGAAGAIGLLLMIMALVVAFKVDAVSRLHLLSVGALTGTYLTCSRVAASGIVGRIRRRNSWGSRVLVVGDGLNAAAYVGGVAQQPEYGLEIIGYLSEDEPEPVALPQLDQLPRMGTVSDLPRLLTSEVIDEVAICLPFDRWPTIRAVAEIAEEQGKSVQMPLWMAGQFRSSLRLEELGSMPILSMVRTPDDVVKNSTKRAVDIVGALVGLVVLLPVLCIAGVLIRREDKGPILFRQTRVGLHGRPFQITKLRTMVVDAEARLAEIQHLNTRSDVLFKAEDDPRVLKVGRFLRRTSLDEIPQLLDVLRGDMSLVGPRPGLPQEVAQYTPAQRRRLSVRPGMTGLWQVRGRQEPSFDVGVEFDLDYIDRWTPMLDAKIVAQTLPAMLSGTGR